MFFLLNELSFPKQRRFPLPCVFFVRWATYRCKSHSFKHWIIGSCQSCKVTVEKTRFPELQEQFTGTSFFNLQGWKTFWWIFVSATHSFRNCPMTVLRFHRSTKPRFRGRRGEQGLVWVWEGINLYTVSSISVCEIDFSSCERFIFCCIFCFGWAFLKLSQT